MEVIMPMIPIPQLQTGESAADDLAVEDEDMHVIVHNTTGAYSIFC